MTSSANLGTAGGWNDRLHCARSLMVPFWARMPPHGLMLPQLGWTGMLGRVSFLIMASAARATRGNYPGITSTARAAVALISPTR